MFFHLFFSEMTINIFNTRLQRKEQQNQVKILFPKFQKEEHILADIFNKNYFWFVPSIPPVNYVC